MIVSRKRFKAAVEAGIEAAQNRVGLTPREVAALREVAETAPAARAGTFGTLTDAPEDQCPWTQAGLSPGHYASGAFYQTFDPRFAGVSRLKILKWWFWK